MRIGVIGYGSIAAHLATALRSSEDIRVACVLARKGREEAAQSVFGPPTQVITSAQDVSANLDLVVEVAGHPGLAAHGETLLSRGLNLVTISAGALADPSLEIRLRSAAIAGNTRLHVASGAIGALDALSAAATGSLHTVRYVGRKPVAGWRGSVAEDVLDLDAITDPTVHFSGTARDAAQLYPKNANVAAAVALAGLGFDATQADLIADPSATGNQHEIHASGDFGSLQFTISGNPLPDNPKTSALAAMSTVRAVLNRRAGIMV